MPAQHLFTLMASGIATLVVIACSSTTKRNSLSSCRVPDADSDSAMMATGIYAECAVDKRAVPVQTQFSLDPSSSPPPGGDPCKFAEVQFVVGTDGKPVPGSIRALRNNYQPLADALAAAVPLWEYRPAILDGQPVRQLVKERKLLTSARDCR
ncbi:MAG TPA: hypothetical protein VGD49_12055 [Longimicrobiales bacterium]